MLGQLIQEQVFNVAKKQKFRQIDEIEMQSDNSNNMFGPIASAATKSANEPMRSFAQMQLN